MKSDYPRWTHGFWKRRQVMETLRFAALMGALRAKNDEWRIYQIMRMGEDAEAQEAIRYQ